MYFSLFINLYTKPWLFTMKNDVLLICIDYRAPLCAPAQEYTYDHPWVSTIKLLNYCPSKHSRMDLGGVFALQLQNLLNILSVFLILVRNDFVWIFSTIFGSKTNAGVQNVGVDKRRSVEILILVSISIQVRLG